MGLWTGRTLTFVPKRPWRAIVLAYAVVWMYSVQTGINGQTEFRFSCKSEADMAEVLFQIKDSQGTAVHGAAVLVAYPNSTYLISRTGADGECKLELYRTDQEMKVLVAAEGYLPFHDTVVPEGQETISFELKASDDERKAMLFTSDTGYIPGLSGRLNPHKDGYVYGNNIAINGRLANPAAPFEIEEPLHLLDVYGVETTIRFLVVEGQFSLIEYTKPKAYGGE